MTRKAIGSTYFLTSITVPNLATLKQTGQKIMSGPHLYKDLDIDLDLWPREQKINKDYIRFRDHMMWWSRKETFEIKLISRKFGSSKSTQQISIELWRSAVWSKKGQPSSIEILKTQNIQWQYNDVILTKQLLTIDK